MLFDSVNIKFGWHILLSQYLCQLLGTVVTVVDEDMEEYEPGYSAITIPYEFLPLPQKGEKGFGYDRSGTKVCEAEVLQVRTSPAFDRTNLLTMKVPADMVMRARFYKAD